MMRVQAKDIQDRYFQCMESNASDDLGDDIFEEDNSSEYFSVLKSENHACMKKSKSNTVKHC